MKVINIKNYESFGKSKSKKQILLTHTSREINNYISSLHHRYTKIKRIPNFLISRNGEIFKLLKDGEYSNFIGDKIDKEIVVISFENLGWLEKVPLENSHINWCGDIYIGEVINRKWRDYFFWQPYTEIQIKKCSELCEELFEKYSIDKKMIGHNTQVDFIRNFNGISTRSNYDKKYTDISPAFDFEILEKHLKNE
jgi:hypothetical protein